MKTLQKKDILQQAGIILLFVVLAFAYFHPVLEGKALNQHDVTKANGMQTEVKAHFKETGEYTLWTNAMFSGMPTYQITSAPAKKANIFHRLTDYIRYKLPRQSVDIIFLYLLGFYIFLLCFDINKWIAVLGAVAFAFSSYNIIIILAGHVNKALTIGMIPIMLGGLVLLFRGRRMLGFTVTLLGAGLQLAFNHFQMTYYAGMFVGIMMVIEVVYAVREKQLKSSSLAIGLFAVAFVFAVLPNITTLWTTYEYSKDTMRGGSELAGGEEKKGGLDKDYAMAWSYGKAESFSLFIPNIQGGSSFSGFDEDSKTYKALLKNGVDRNTAENISGSMGYWGDQSITYGPVYFGAVIVFLFVLGLFLVKGKVKYWFLVGTVFSILMALGKNFWMLTSLFFEYFPMYNKFRAVSSILVMTSITMPALGFIALSDIYKGKITKADLMKGLKYAVGITGGLALIFILFGNAFFTFEGPRDAQMRQAGYPGWLLDAVREDRAALLRQDAFRSLVLVLLTAGAVYAYHLKKVTGNVFIVIVGVLIVFDLWGVDTRYVGSDEFVEKKQAKEVQPSPADLQILKDKGADYRVFNLTSDPFSETYTSYFHKSIGGYHGAKLARYQDLIERHISKNNPAVLNMLNTKYYIVPGENKQPMPQYNPGALGNAWYAGKLQKVDGAREAIDALNGFDPSATAIVEKPFQTYFEAHAFSAPDSNDVINLTEYEPDKLVYNSKASTANLAVFSEVYYNSGKGWNAYIDGEKAEHIRVNYILRALVIPEGSHTVEFKFEPASYHTAQNIAGASSIAVLIIILGLSYMEYRRKSNEQEATEE